MKNIVTFAEAMKNIKNDIKNVRKYIFKLSETKFGKLLGVSRATIVRYEKGDVIPSLNFLENLINELKKLEEN